MSLYAPLPPWPGWLVPILNSPVQDALDKVARAALRIVTHTPNDELMGDHFPARKGRPRTAR